MLNNAKRDLQPRSKKTGFTLLELLVVMAILAMMVALVIPRLGSSDVTMLKAQVREAVAMLKYARRSAIVEGKQTEAIFQTGKRETTTKSAATAGRWTSRGATLQWSEDSNKKEAAYKFTFFPEGGSSGGEIILSYLKHKAKISVSPLTGKIESEILNEN